jgi:hypothetical protein
MKFRSAQRLHTTADLIMKWGSELLRDYILLQTPLWYEVQKCWDCILLQTSLWDETWMCWRTTYSWRPHYEMKFRSAEGLQILLWNETQKCWGTAYYCRPHCEIWLRSAEGLHTTLTVCMQGVWLIQHSATNDRTRITETLNLCLFCWKEKKIWNHQHQSRYESGTLF